jgi:hypothetical protein
VPVQFALSYRADVIAVGALIPVGFLVLASIFALMLEDVKTIRIGPPMALWSMLITTYGLSHMALLLSPLLADKRALRLLPLSDPVQRRASVPLGLDLRPSPDLA